MRARPPSDASAPGSSRDRREHFRCAATRAGTCRGWHCGRRRRKRRGPDRDHPERSAVHLLRTAARSTSRATRGSSRVAGGAVLTDVSPLALPAIARRALSFGRAIAEDPRVARSPRRRRSRSSAEARSGCRCTSTATSSAACARPATRCCRARCVCRWRSTRRRRASRGRRRTPTRCCAGARSPLQRVGVGDLDDEAVLDHRRHREAARLDDVRPRFRKRSREVLEQPMAVPRVDLDLDGEGARASFSQLTSVKRSALRASAAMFGQSGGGS